MQKDRTTRVLVDLCSIPSFEFNYKTKCMALTRLVRHYEDLPTLAEDAEGIESSIVIKDHPFVQYEVSFEFDNEEALAHMPLTREALGYINLRELVDCWDSEEVDTFAEAKERAMAIERDRRDQLVSISNGRRALLNELIHRGPKVTIKPVVTEDSDFLIEADS